jgi:hypothetical protein
VNKEALSTRQRLLEEIEQLARRGESGKTTGYYVPKAAESKVRRGVEAWIQLQTQLRQLSALNPNAGSMKSKSNTRVAVPKRIRVEVFKRDSFRTWSARWRLSNGRMPGTCGITPLSLGATIRSLRRRFATLETSCQGRDFGRNQCADLIMPNRPWIK